MTSNQSKNWLRRLSLILLIGIAFSFLLAYFIDSPILPSPFKVILAFKKLWRKKIYWHLLMSLWRVFAGLFIGVLFGALLGILMGKYERWNQWLDPVVYLVYPIPKMALLPVALLFFWHWRMV